MRKRWKLLLATLLILALLGVLESQRILSGWLRGEAFYQGRPTSYWRGELLAWEVTESFACGPLKEEGGGPFCHHKIHWKREPRGFLEETLAWFLGLPTPTEPALLNGDSAALAVLEELAQDKSLKTQTLLFQAKQQHQFRSQDPQ